MVEQIHHEPVLYSDSTSWNVNGQRAVAWVFTTFRATVYWIDPKGSGLVPLTVLGEEIEGAVVTDSAERFQYVTHRDDPRCLAHPLRTARDLLAAHPEEVEAFRGGKTKLQGFFVGQLMKKTGGKADPKLANQILNQKLKG